MFDWLRNLRKTKEEKQRERLTAYIDDELSSAERQLFERELADNDDLRATVEAEQQVKLLLSQAPRLRAPRNFTLDPAVYGVPQRPTLAMRLYPQLRVATAVMAVLLVGVISLEFLSGSVPPETAAPAQDVAQIETVAEPELFAVEEAEEAEDMEDAAGGMAEAEAEAEMEAPLAAESAPAPAADSVEELAETEETAGEMEMADEDISATDGETIAETEVEEVEIQEVELAEEAAAEDAPDNETMTAEEATAADMEMADDAGDAAVAPRPQPTSLPNTRVEESPPPTATPQPTSTISAPSPTVGATVMPIPSIPVDVPQPNFQRPFLRITQIAVGLATAVLLALTLYFRRRL